MSSQDHDVPLLAAQPIFDRHQRVYGVELLYRDDLDQSALDVGEDRATAEVIFNFCAGVSEQVEQYRAPAFINVSASFIQSGAFLPVAPERVIVELVERITPCPELVACVRNWYRQGFRFALDDFAFEDNWNPLLPYTSIIKVDVSQTTYEEAVRQKRKLNGLEMMWLAERIEDEAEHERYFTAGFDLFQGYFFARPSPIYGRKMHPSGLQLIRLMSELSRVEREMFGLHWHLDRLVQIISEDPHLAVKLLKIANSTFYRSHAKISSIRQVILRFGISHLKKWVVLFGLLEFNAIEHARLVLIRANVCERLVRARHYPGCDYSRAYLVGLLSGVDLLYDVDPQQFILQLQIDDSIRNAVLSRRGELGRVIGDVLETERRLIQNEAIDRISPHFLDAFRNARHEVAGMLREARG